MHEHHERFLIGSDRDVVDLRPGIVRIFVQKVRILIDINGRLAQSDGDFIVPDGIA